jgi:hypothetical protein
MNGILQSKTLITDDMVHLEESSVAYYFGSSVYLFFCHNVCNFKILLYLILQTIPRNLFNMSVHVKKYQSKAL